MDNFKRLASVLRWKSPQAAVLIIAAVHLGIFSPTAAGCECAPLPPPCVAYTNTEMIFLGTITELEKGVAQMRIDKAYKGVLVKTVALWDSGMCPGPALHVGEQYLIYTRDDGTGYFLSGACTRSRNARDAKEDMAFLDGLSKAPPTSTVFGRVTVRSGSISSEGEPVPGAVVEIQVEGKSRKSTADREGRYLFSGLAPGLYSVKASLPGFSQSESESDDPVEVIARGCAVHDVVLRRNWNGTLSGRVVRADGAPGPAGINVDLIRIDSDAPGGKSELLIGFTVQTDDQGVYSFHDLAPGLYKIVLNLYKPPLRKIRIGRSTGRRRAQKRLPPPSRSN